MKKTNENKLIVLFIASLIIIIYLYNAFVSNKKTYATVPEKQVETVKVSKANTINIEEIIKNNTLKSEGREEIFEKQEELEYITKYKKSDEIYVGTTRVAQEGRNGIQTITMKKIYNNDGEFVKEEQVGARVTKSSLDKIIEIGTKIYIEPEKETENENYSTADGTISFDMPLNKPSGFTIEQFKVALTDSKDKNKVFEENAEYFYYIEGQYNINGMFVAAIGIHESAWGTSKIARNKYNLFGYGAYDSNPYNGAYSFSTYSESIDLLARVLVKYYLNPKGTPIYDGQVASGKYYNGNTVSAVNQKYATDKNWANSVYKHMQYLYNKIV